MTPKIVKAFPPNFIRLAEVFPIRGKQGIIYAYGNRIYNPSGVKVLPWVLEHEKVHCERQFEVGIGIWWDAYVAFPDFRLSEEVLAHRKEWSMTQDLISCRDRMHYLDMMVDRLSSSLYGNLVTSEQARTLITENN